MSERITKRREMKCTKTYNKSKKIINKEACSFFTNNKTCTVVMY